MTDAEGLGVKLEDRETVIKELKKSLKIKVTLMNSQPPPPPPQKRKHSRALLKKEGKALDIFQKPLTHGDVTSQP